MGDEFEMSWILGTGKTDWKKFAAEMMTHRVGVTRWDPEPMSVDAAASYTYMCEGRSLVAELHKACPPISGRGLWSTEVHPPHVWESPDVGGLILFCTGDYREQGTSRSFYKGPKL